jgi:hypothetical protein
MRLAQSIELCRGFGTRLDVQLQTADTVRGVFANDRRWHEVPAEVLGKDEGCDSALVERAVRKIAQRYLTSPRFVDPKQLDPSSPFNLAANV